MRKLDRNEIEKRERQLQTLEAQCQIDTLRARLKMCESAAGPGIDRHKAEWRRELLALRSKIIDLHDEGKPVTTAKKSHFGRREFAAFVKK